MFRRGGAPNIKEEGRRLEHTDKRSAGDPEVDDEAIMGFSENAARRALQREGTASHLRH